MTIQVRFFASLREKFSLSDQQIEIDAPLPALEVWRRLSDQPLPTNTLIAINQEFAKPTSLVSNGDEVAFFPPVTGG